MCRFAGHKKAQLSLGFLWGRFQTIQAYWPVGCSTDQAHQPAPRLNDAEGVAAVSGQS